MDIPDFKNKQGRWARTAWPEGAQVCTRAGRLYGNLSARTRLGVTQLRSPRYKGCVNGFGGFQEFAEWCQWQKGFHEKFELDKDLLLKGNKLYSADTCIFLPSEINKLLTKAEASRGRWPIGVSLKDTGRFTAQVQTGSGVKHIGYFGTPELAFAAYKVEKEKIIKLQAEKWRWKLDVRAYNALLAYEVEQGD